MIKIENLTKNYGLLKLWMTLALKLKKARF